MRAMIFDPRSKLAPLETRGDLFIYLRSHWLARTDHKFRLVEINRAQRPPRSKTAKSWMPNKRKKSLPACLPACCPTAELPRLSRALALASLLFLPT